MKNGTSTSLIWGLYFLLAITCLHLPHIQTTTEKSLSDEFSGLFKSIPII